MIRKYKPERIYNPKSFQAEVRRASKAQIDRGFKYVPLTSRATRLIMLMPGMKQMLKLIISSGQKLIAKHESMELITRKEETKCLYPIQ